jgi:hypothetical protein
MISTSLRVWIAYRGSRTLFRPFLRGLFNLQREKEQHHHHHDCIRRRSSTHDVLRTSTDDDAMEEEEVHNF